MLPAQKPSRSEELRRADRRWFMVSAFIFAGSCVGLLGARELYRATAPHPHLAYVLRRMRFYANSLLRQRLRRSSK